MEGPLFYSGGYIQDFFEARREALRLEIEKYGRDYFLNVSEADLTKLLIDKYSFTAPSINEDGICVANEEEVRIDVSRDPMWSDMDDEGPRYAKGIAITIAVPFEGDGVLFNFRPSSYTLSPPRGEVAEQEIHIIYKRLSHDAEELKRDYQGDVKEIKSNLQVIQRDVQQYNESLLPFIRDSIIRRKEKIMKDTGLVASLGLPIRKRDGAPKTYAIPDIRKKAVLTPPPATEKAFKPEPALDMALYENALDIIKGMVHVMERSPRAFATMGEEDLRQHFLVQLNGQFEGSATGETFNYEGKTDILIRNDDRNVFIAECKFWKGEKGLSETIDQILNYTSWRDTKTAIILFNRGKNFSSVLEKIPVVVKAHACFKRDGGKREETEFRFVFHQPDDVNRELILTVMAFNVPVPEKPARSS
jgi:hypothetical protein